LLGDLKVICGIEKTLPFSHTCLNALMASQLKFEALGHQIRVSVIDGDALILYRFADVS